MKKKPNILLILADQHNAKVTGYNGHPSVRTPALDRMAAEGAVFNTAITQNPICTPSRVSWLSGQYCHNHGYYDLSGPEPYELPNILGYSRNNGYMTAAIGKIHCPEYWIEDSSDLFLDSCGTSIGGRPEYDEYLESRGLTGLEDHASYPEFGRRGMQTCDARPSNLGYRDSQEGWIASRAMQFIEEAIGNEKPFIAHVSFPKPHQCYAPSPEFWDLYDEKDLILPPNVDYDLEGKAPHMKKTAKWWKTREWTLFEPHGHENGRLRKLHGYLGCISQVDHAVGELLDFLEEKGLREDTIVVYSSDHGDYACEHGIMEKAPGICSDAITRVPLLISWPGKIKGGTLVSDIVESVDVFPTLCELAGMEMPETADGVSLCRKLNGEDTVPKKIGVTENPWSKSIRKGKYRYVYYPVEMFKEEYPDGFHELYDLEEDPWEMNNLFFDEKYSKLANEIRSDLLDWLVTTTRPRTMKTVKGMKIGNQTKERYHTVIGADGKADFRWAKDSAEKNYL